jgi:uncharacterized membrane-anchored protein
LWTTTRRWVSMALTYLLANNAFAQESARAPAAEENPIATLDWIVGPTQVDVAGRAQLTIPEGYAYLEPGETAKFQELIQNPSNGRESMIAPQDLSWFGLLEFEAVGYVKDDDEIYATDLLESVQDGTAQANAERRERGWGELKIVGWQYEPRYDEATHRLEWAIIGESPGQRSVNFNTRLLGRKGVTSALLVAAPEDLDAATIAFKEVLGDFAYRSGERYADVQEGDRIAEYGLAALIAGGGAAAAAKAGLFKGLGNFIVGIGVAAMAGFRALFGRKKQAA